MTRYTTRPRQFVGDDWPECDNPLLPSLSVDDHEAVFTGLVDAKGEQIWRQPNPMGFGRDSDW